VGDRKDDIANGIHFLPTPPARTTQAGAFLSTNKKRINFKVIGKGFASMKKTGFSRKKPVLGLLLARLKNRGFREKTGFREGICETENTGFSRKNPVLGRVLARLKNRGFKKKPGFREVKRDIKNTVIWEKLRPNLTLASGSG
jgi:hypothetical protein